MRYFIKLAYDGTPFCGWQIQPNGISVQGELQHCFSLILSHPTEIIGCGRTDAGVHARLFYAHFDSENTFDESQLKELVRKLNSFLHKSVVIYSIFPVPDDFHARFSAVERTYRYYLNRSKNPFTSTYSYAFYFPLNRDLMNQAAFYLLDVEDFTSFSKVHTQTRTNLCEVTHACWIDNGEQWIFEISANRFLRNMVRAIVGTLLWVGSGRISLSDFQDIVSARNRCDAGFSVPAHALFLENIRYETTFQNIISL